MAKIQKGRPVLTSIGILKEYTIRICRCKKHVCSIEDLKEYEILVREQKHLMHPTTNSTALSFSSADDLR